MQGWIFWTASNLRTSILILISRLTVGEYSTSIFTIDSSKTSVPDLPLSSFPPTSGASDADIRMVFPCGESRGIYFRDVVTYSPAEPLNGDGSRRASGSNPSYV